MEIFDSRYKSAYSIIAEIALKEASDRLGVPIFKSELALEIFCESREQAKAIAIQLPAIAEFLEHAPVPRYIRLFDEERKISRCYDFPFLLEARSKRSVLMTKVENHGCILPGIDLSGIGTNFQMEYLFLNQVTLSPLKLTVVRESDGSVLAASSGYCQFTGRSLFEWLAENPKAGNVRRWQPDHLRRLTEYLNRDGKVESYEWKAAHLQYGDEPLSWYGAFQRLWIGNDPVRLCRIDNVDLPK